MGIISLTSFLDGFPGILTPHHLQNTHVIIDGNNLCHALYHDCGVSCFFGGDYDKFAHRIKEYFLIYKKCRITPMIVFDGAYEKRKLKTSVNRAEERYVIAKQFSQGKLLKTEERKGILPILAMDVFHDVLNDMKIPLVQCNFEADAHIAAIANHFQCPVLSLDSDFYIFDLKCGFIPLNLIDMNIKCNSDESPSYKYLECKIYHVDNFLEEFDTPDRLTLPLFGTLLGNDFVTTSTFNHFFEQLNIQKLKLTKHRISKRHQKIIGLLAWLQSRTKDEAISLVLNFFKKEHRERLKTIIHETIEGYTRIQTSNVLHVLDKEVNIENFTEDAIEMPDWFTDYFNQGIVPPFVLNALLHQRVVLSVQTESQDQASTYAISRPIRQVIYGLMHLIKQSVGKDTVSGDHLVVKEFDRVGRNLQNVTTEGINEIPKLGFLPVLSDISPDEARTLLLKVLGTDEKMFSTFPSGLRFVMLIVRFWIINANPRVTDSEVCSAIVCILYLSMFDTKSRFKKSFQCLNTRLEEIFEKASETNFQKVALKLSKYRKMPEFTRIKHFNVSGVHNFSQLQTCYLYVFYLNRLLKFPFTSVSASKLFSGTFLYNLCVEFQSNRAPQVHTKHVLGGDETAIDLFTYVIESLLESLPRHISLQQSYRPKIRRQKKKSKSNSTATVDNQNTSEESSVDEDATSSDAYEVTVDVCNKFQALID